MPWALPFVDDDAAGVGVGCVIEHLRGGGRRAGAFAQGQQLAQAFVFQQELLDLPGAA